MTQFPLHVALPNGQWAELRDPEEVSERQRRLVRKAQMRISLHANEMQEAQRLASSGVVQADGTIDPADTAEVLSATKRLVESGALDDVDDAVDVSLSVLVCRWSFDGPVTLDAIVDLPGGAYTALRAAAQPLFQGMSPDFDPSPDQDSPISPSSD